MGMEVKEGIEVEVGMEREREGCVVEDSIFNDQHMVEEHYLQVQSRFNSDVIDADICAVMKSQIAHKSHRKNYDYNI